MHMLCNFFSFLIFFFMLFCFFCTAPKRDLEIIELAGILLNVVASPRSLLRRILIRSVSFPLRSAYHNLNIFLSFNFNLWHFISH